MDLFEAIERRYSCRGDFTDSPVPREHLRRIVQAGIQAASACNEQVTSFVIVDDAALLAQIAQIVGRPVCRSAKAMIVCVSDPRPVMRGVSFSLEDCATAVGNMLLAITALGYATVWLDGVLRSDNIADQLAWLLSVPKGHVVRVLLPIGVPTQPGHQRERLPFEKRAYFNTWGKTE